MKILIIPALALVAWALGSCGAASKPTFCDTTCNNDSLKYIHPHPDTPFVYISVKNCEPDTIAWSHKNLATTRKMGFYELVGKNVKMNKGFVDCYFNDTSYAWLRFNDCNTGRGFLVKLPYNKSDKWSIYTSALNKFDPKFYVEDGLIAYYDETFVYAQDLATGKMDRMLMNNTRLEIDHNNVHKTFDTVHITRDRIWARIMINNKFTDKEKKIEMQ